MGEAVRWRTPLPLDGCLEAGQPSLPHLTCSSVHRCLRSSAAWEIPSSPRSGPKKGSHTSLLPWTKLAVAQLIESDNRKTANRKTAGEGLEHLLEAAPEKIQAPHRQPLSGRRFGKTKSAEQPRTGWRGDIPNYALGPEMISDTD